jgi:hypothetical protein
MSRMRDAYAKFLKERFPLPTESEVASLERHIGVAFPEDFRRYVLEFNGGYFDEPEIGPVSADCPKDTLNCLYGINASRPFAELGSPATLALFDENDPPKILPVGSTGMGGLIILVTESEGCGEIFLKQAFGNFHFLANNVAEFFKLLREPTWN